MHANMNLDSWKFIHEARIEGEYPYKAQLCYVISEIGILLKSVIKFHCSHALSHEILARTCI